MYYYERNYKHKNKNILNIHRNNLETFNNDRILDVVLWRLINKAII